MSKRVRTIYIFKLHGEDITVPEEELVGFTASKCEAIDILEKKVDFLEREIQEIMRRKDLNEH